jgi:DNA-binding response OmpR family regulator
MNRILIIEDDPCIRMIYRAGLEAEGFEVEDLSDGKSAIEFLKSNTPNLIVLDLMLPEVTGIDVLRFLRRFDSTKKVPVIVLSNAYERGMTEGARMAGANLCLCKTECNPRNMVREIRSLLAPAATLPARVVPTPVVLESSAPKTTSEVSAKAEMRTRVFGLRSSLQQLGKADANSRAARLLELRRAVHGIAGSAAVAEMKCFARVSCALEALLNELHTQPAKLNPSSLRTVAQAVDLLVSMVDKVEPESSILETPRILVVDDEPVSRLTVCAALGKAALPAMVLDDPAMALRLIDENQFDLVFLDVEMPGLNGFDVCKHLRSTPLNAMTPVVFVTALNDFDTRTRSSLSGGTDFIAKPVLLMELAVKTLIHLLRPRPVAFVPKTVAQEKAGGSVPQREVMSQVAA